MRDRFFATVEKTAGVSFNGTTVSFVAHCYMGKRLASGKLS